jgi:hypothetical protein
VPEEVGAGDVGVVLLALVQVSPLLGCEAADHRDESGLGGGCVHRRLRAFNA